MMGGGWHLCWGKDEMWFCSEEKFECDMISSSIISKYGFLEMFSLLIFPVGYSYWRWTIPWDDFENRVSYLYIFIHMGSEGWK